MIWAEATKDERVAEIVRLFDRNRHLSAADIASIVQAPSRSAILGYIHRHKIVRPRNTKLTRGEEMAAHRAKAKAKRKAHAAAARVLLKRKPKVEFPVSLPAREDAWLALPGTVPVRVEHHANSQCRWPIGEPESRDFGFCGCEVGEKQVYCAVHKAMSVRKVAA